MKCPRCQNENAPASRFCLQCAARISLKCRAYEANLFPDLEYTFKHALIHEVAYAGVLRERRQEMHARIMRAIEAQALRLLGEGWPDG